MCDICDNEHPAIVVEVAGHAVHPRTRGELEAALGGRATPNPDLIANDDDWKPEHCFCALDPMRTAHSADVQLDFDYVAEDGRKVPLYYHN